LPGLGAVATTFIAGVLLARRGLGTPVGSLTQMGSLRVGNATERISDFVPLRRLDRLEFAAWDLFPDNAFEAATHAEVLSEKHLNLVRDELEAIDGEGIGGPVIRRVTAEPTLSQRGSMLLDERRPWDPHRPLFSFQVDFDLTGPEQEGLSRAERRNLLEAA